MKLAFFTICAKNYLAHARVLFASLERHHPEAERVLVLSDRLEDALDASEETFRIREAAELGIEHFDDMALRYNVVAFSTAIKAAAFQALFRDTNGFGFHLSDARSVAFQPSRSFGRTSAPGSSLIETELTQ